MVDELLQPFYSVMHKYEKYFSDLGVKANLEKWEANKAGLLAMLRRHPDWNEEAKAVILGVQEDRSIDRTEIQSGRDSLSMLANSNLKRDSLQAFASALGAATNAYNYVLTERQVELIKADVPIKCAAGQKTSRAINRICTHFGVNQIEGYNAIYAKLSDALNPLAFERKAVLSVHPCDYLEMSNKDNTWSSCHGLLEGGYQTGCLSYMNDATSMIFYTVDEDITEEFWKAPKRSRQVFCYSNGLLLQSRLYPEVTNEQHMLLYRNIVQKIIADSCETPNLWKLKKEEFKTHLLTAKESHQYPDYYHGHGTLSILNSQDSCGSIFIGDHALCVCCGKSLRNDSELYCDCEKKIVCADCGQTVSEASAQYFEGRWYCYSCLHTCKNCGVVSRDPLVMVYDGRGNPIEMCAACAEHRMSACEGCNIRSICGAVTSNRFCPRMAELADAA